MENFRTNFKQGETPRAELELPRLHFIVMDNWIDVIGDKALFAWLKMFTWCDRTGAKENPQLWNESRIPRSLNKVSKDLGVGKDTFYNKIMKPLWNVGLIDLEEYGESDAKGNKPMNIIVYKYPQNKYELSVQPLEMVRDYDKDYSSDAKTFALRKREKSSLSEEQIEEIDGLFEGKIDGSETEPGVVPNENHPPFQDRTIPGSEIEHNNSINLLNNNPNPLNNNINHENNILNINSSSSYSRAKKQKTDDDEKFNLLYQQGFFKLLMDLLEEYNLRDKIIQRNCAYYLYKNRHMTIHEKHTRKAIEKIIAYVDNGGGYSNLGSLIGNEIIQSHQSVLGGMALRTKKQEEMQQLEEESIPFYNWLEAQSES